MTDPTTWAGVTPTHPKIRPIHQLMLQADALWRIFTELPQDLQRAYLPHLLALLNALSLADQVDLGLERPVMPKR